MSISSCDSPIMPDSTDIYNPFEDLSGVSEKASTVTTESSNPYNTLIATCKNAVRTSPLLPGSILKGKKQTKSKGKCIGGNHKGL